MLPCISLWYSRYENLSVTKTKANKYLQTKRDVCFHIKNNNVVLAKIFFTTSDECIQIQNILVEKLIHF